jgi:hypothetical protein
VRGPRHLQTTHYSADDLIHAVEAYTRSSIETDKTDRVSMLQPIFSEEPEEMSLTASVVGLNVQQPSAASLHPRPEIFNFLLPPNSEVTDCPVGRNSEAE